MRILVVEDEPKLAQALKEGTRGERTRRQRCPYGRGRLSFSRRLSRSISSSSTSCCPAATASKSWGICAGSAIARRFCFSPRKTRLRTACAALIPALTITSPNRSRFPNYRLGCALFRGAIRPNRKRSSDSKIWNSTAFATLPCAEGRLLDLMAREFELLEYLMRNAQRVVSREVLAREVWKESSRYTPIDNVIDVHIARLRRKMDDPYPLKLLRTVRGVGFVLRPD